MITELFGTDPKTYSPEYDETKSQFPELKIDKHLGYMNRFFAGRHPIKEITDPDHLDTLVNAINGDPFMRWHWSACRDKTLNVDDMKDQHAAYDDFGIYIPTPIEQHETINQATETPEPARYNVLCLIPKTDVAHMITHVYKCEVYPDYERWCVENFVDVREVDIAPSTNHQLQVQVNGEEYKDAVIVPAEQYQTYPSFYNAMMHSSQESYGCAGTMARADFVIEQIGYKLSHHDVLGIDPYVTELKLLETALENMLDDSKDPIPVTYRSNPSHSICVPNVYVGYCLQLLRSLTTLLHGLMYGFSKPAVLDVPIDDLGHQDDYFYRPKIDIRHFRHDWYFNPFVGENIVKNTPLQRFDDYSDSTWNQQGYGSAFRSVLAAMRTYVY